MLDLGMDLDLDLFGAFDVDLLVALGLPWEPDPVSFLYVVFLYLVWEWDNEVFKKSNTYSLMIVL